MRLKDWLVALGPTRLRAVSRIVLDPGPGHMGVQASIALYPEREPVGIHPTHAGGLEERPILRRPVGAEDEAGRALQNPPVVMFGWDREPDAEGVIESADLPGQLRELEDSGIVGSLNVEPLGERKTIVSTHAGTQAERSRGSWAFGATARNCCKRPRPWSRPGPGSPLLGDPGASVLSRRASVVGNLEGARL